MFGTKKRVGTVDGGWLVVKTRDCDDYVHGSEA